jgi:hypothetical protein
LAWTVEYDPRVEKDLKAIDRAMQREILDYMDSRIATDENPRRFGKPCRRGRHEDQHCPSTRHGGGRHVSNPGGCQRVNGCVLDKRLGHHFVSKEEI